MSPQLIKELCIGPYSISEYRDIKIKKYKQDPDEFEFIINYIFDKIGNNIVNITESRKYYIENTKLITDIEYYYTKKELINKRDIKYFGSASECDQTTLVGEPVWIAPVDTDANDYNNTMRQNYNKIKKKLNLYTCNPGDSFKIIENKVVERVQNTYKKSNGFQVFKPSASLMDLVKNTPENTTPGTYRPPGVSNKRGTSTLVIKNIPKYLNRDYIFQKLKDIFSKYGAVNKVNVLRDKLDNNKVSGIAFIDFYDHTSLEKILQSDKKFVVEHNILSLEKSKGEK